MDPEISRRLGFLLKKATLTDEQEAYIFDACLDAPTFDELPPDILMWFTEAEREFGVHPEYADQVEQQQQSIADEAVNG